MLMSKLQQKGVAVKRALKKTEETDGRGGVRQTLEGERERKVY